MAHIIGVADNLICYRDSKNCMLCCNVEIVKIVGSVVEIVKIVRFRNSRNSMLCRVQFHQSVFMFTFRQ